MDAMQRYGKIVSSEDSLSGGVRRVMTVYQTHVNPKYNSFPFRGVDHLLGTHFLALSEGLAWQSLNSQVVEA